jgi:hypothetical protein
LTDEEKKNIKKNELSVLDKIVTRVDNEDMFTEEEKQIMEEIENFPLTEEQIDNAEISKLSGDEEKIATQRLSTDDTEITEEKKKEKIKKFKILKLQYELYKEMEKKDNTKYKILKMKKNKVDMIKDYELLLKKVEKKFDTLYLVHSKQEFLNDMKMKQIEAQNELARSQQRKNTRRGTKRKTNRLANNKKVLKTENYKIIAEDGNEEEDEESKMEDVDTKILKKFLDEQRKEKDNFVSGKVKIEDKK